MDVQADLRLCWAHRSLCWFCRAAAEIVKLFSTVKTLSNKTHPTKKCALSNTSERFTNTTVNLFTKSTFENFCWSYLKYNFDGLCKEVYEISNVLLYIILKLCSLCSVLDQPSSPKCYSSHSSTVNSLIWSEIEPVWDVMPVLVTTSLKTIPSKMQDGAIVFTAFSPFKIYAYGSFWLPWKPEFWSYLPQYLMQPFSPLQWCFI